MTAVVRTCCGWGCSLVEHNRQLPVLGEQMWRVGLHDALLGV